VIRRMDDRGVSNVVSLVMIAGILISLMGMVFSTYLPAWGKDVEAQMLYDVMDSFMDLKSSVDQLSVRGDPGTSMATKITLGSGGGPVFGFGRCTGALQIDEVKGSLFLSDSDGNLYGNSRGSVSFSSYTTYVSEQSIYYEGGMLIREQGGTSILKGPPNIILDDDLNTGDRVLYVLLATIEGDLRSYSGSETYMISMTLLSEVTSSYDISAASAVVDVITDHNATWQDHFTEMCQVQGVPLSDLDLSTYQDGDGNDVLRMSLDGIDRLEVKSAVFRMTVS